MVRIVEKKRLNPTVTQMVVEHERIAKKAKAGQFIILRVDEKGERIPLTIADTDPERHTVTIIFQIVGATTKKLNELNENDYIHDFVGPLGKPSEIEGLKKVCVIGGGVGCAIAYPTAKALHKQGSDVTTIVEERPGVLWIGSHYGLNRYDVAKRTFTQYFHNPTDPHSISDNCIKHLLCDNAKRIWVGNMKGLNLYNKEIPDFDGHEVDFDEAISRNTSYREFEKHAYEKTCALLNKEVQ